MPLRSRALTGPRPPARVAKPPRGAPRTAPDAVRPPHAPTRLGAGCRACCRLASALPRNELAALILGGVGAVRERGLRLRVHRSKFDPQDQGQAVVSGPTATSRVSVRWPPVLLDEPSPGRARPGPDSQRRIARRTPAILWRHQAGRITDDKLSDKAVARLVKPVALDARFNSEWYPCHALRAGLVS
jgi:hypothetical protein